MERKNLDIAMELFAHLITGEAVSKTNYTDLYEAYHTQAEVYDILEAVLKKSNLSLYEYKQTLYITAGYQNRIFGFTNDELKRAIGLRLNKELFLAYVIIFRTMMLFYENTSDDAAFLCVRAEKIIESVTASFNEVMPHIQQVAENELEESSFRTLAALWDELPLVTDHEDISSLKAARGSKTGFVKLVFNFLIEQGLFVESGGQYYITERMMALTENYYDQYKGRLYALLQDKERPEKEEDYAAY